MITVHEFVGQIGKCLQPCASWVREWIRTQPLFDISNVAKAVLVDAGHTTSKVDVHTVRKYLTPYIHAGTDMWSDVPTPWDRFTCVYYSHISREWTMMLVKKTHTGTIGFQFVQIPGEGSDGVQDWFALTVADGNCTGMCMYLPTDWELQDILVGCALALASAKNASWVQVGATRTERKRYASIAGTRAHHIEIDMGKPKCRHDASDDPDEGHTPWHLRRGHWAQYTEDKPLFGRAGSHGWFWRPMMEVGDRKNGEVIKDYSIATAQH